MAILLYSRRGCLLCDEAEDMLAALGVPAELIDVDGEPAATARYGLRVPVLEIDGEVVCEGRFEEQGLAAALGGLTGRGELPGERAGRRAARPT